MHSVFCDVFNGKQALHSECNHLWLIGNLNVSTFPYKSIRRVGAIPAVINRWRSHYYLFKFSSKRQGWHAGRSVVCVYFKSCTFATVDNIRIGNYKFCLLRYFHGDNDGCKSPSLQYTGDPKQNKWMSSIELDIKTYNHLLCWFPLLIKSTN